MWTKDSYDRIACRSVVVSASPVWNPAAVVCSLWCPLLIVVTGCRGEQAVDGWSLTFAATILVENKRLGFGEASTGGHGAMFADATGDGLTDLYLTRNLADPLSDLFFRNAGGSRLMPEAVERGIDDLNGGSHGACWCDSDNDRDYDLLNGSTYPGGPSPGHITVFRNDGVGRFREVTEASGISMDREWPTRAVLCLDMDRDGDLDIFAVSGYLGSHDPASERNEVYRNEGGLTFTPVRAGDLFAVPAGQGAADTDSDSDGDVDVIAANRTGELNILRNNGSGNFRLIRPTSIGIRHQAGDGVSIGDVDNDGDPDFGLCGDDYGHLYLNDGGGRLSYAQSFDGTGGYMGALTDLDNDRDIDLVFAGDDRVSINAGFGRFVIGPTMPVTFLDDPRAIASGDVDSDGDVDLAVGAKHSENRIFWNRSEGGRWLEVRLVSPQGQAGAFGARTAIYPAGWLGGADLLGWREPAATTGTWRRTIQYSTLALGCTVSWMWW